ncbi:MAG TPA: glycosyltransferase [Longimicrobiaceae bacterium]|nr:glycosyltransferase [Longimicrobiaceae bacterium]
MKIALHLDGATLRGSEVQALLVAAELRKRGHELVASCRADGPVRAELERLGIPATGVRPQGDADLLSALRFAAWLRRQRPDALLLTSWKRLFVASWAARRARVPRVVFRVGSVQRVPRGVRGWEARRAFRRYVHATIANSREVGRALLRSVPGLREETVYAVPNGVRLSPAPPAPLRAQLGLGDDALLAAAVGGLERRKGFDLLVEAVARSGVPSLHAVVAGEGPEGPALRALAERLGVGDRVHWLGQRRDVAAVLAACDLFVLSSRAEGMAVAMLEAMTARLPVVAADVGGVWEAVSPREGRPPAGWVVPPNDAAALAAALAEAAAALRGDPTPVIARVDEAAWRLRHWFTVERMIDGVEAALRGDPWP